MQNLGDLGADVIKIERPVQGDDTRHWGPPWMGDAADASARESAPFLSTNRNKRSVAIDLAVPDGQRLARQLAERCDVVVENYKVGALARYGLDYPAIRAVRAVRANVIYLSLTAYGQDGPYADRPGYDYIFQGLGGLMSVTGERDDRPGGGPQRCGVPLVDLFTGMYATVAILAALNHRLATGRGQHIDLSLFDTALALSSAPLSNYMLSQKVPGRLGNASPNIAPYGVFPASDGELIIAGANQSQWVSLCAAIGAPALTDDPRFATNADRLAHYDALHAALSERLRTRTGEQWEAILTQAGVPAGPINNYAKALSHPQAVHRGARIDLLHSLGEAAPGVASPMRFSETPVEYRRPPPQLGEHTFEVLREQLALDDETLSRFVGAGVIAGRG